MAKPKSSTRVNGRNNEVMRIDDGELFFKTGGKEQSMPQEVVRDIYIANTEEAREAVTVEDLIPYGAWTEEMPSVEGKSVFVVVKGKASLWVMEINKSQIPNASSFVNGVLPKDEGEKHLYVPDRAINTPLGAVFTLGSIACIFLAVFAVFLFQLPILGLIFAVAAIVMFINVK